jgi:hypothetical protein
MHVNAKEGSSMRIMYAIAAVAAAVAAASTAAVAAEDGKQTARKHSRATYAAVQQQQRARPVETMEDIRANSLDPAGNYKGYPSWARSAFGGPYGGGGRD